MPDYEQIKKFMEDYKHAPLQQQRLLLIIPSALVVPLVIWVVKLQKEIPSEIPRIVFFSILFITVLYLIVLGKSLLKTIGTLLLLSGLYVFFFRPGAFTLPQETITPTTTPAITFTDTPNPIFIPSQTQLPLLASTTVVVTNDPAISPTPFVCPPRIGIVKADNYPNYDKVLMELKKQYVIIKEIDAIKIRDEVNNREIDLIYFPADWADNKYIEQNSADFLSALDNGIGFLVEAPDLLYKDKESHEYSILPSVRFSDWTRNSSLPRKIENHFITETENSTSTIVPDARILIQANSPYYKVIGWQETETGAKLPSILIYEEPSQSDKAPDRRIAILATSGGYFTGSDWKLMNKIILWAGHCDQ